MLMVSLQWHAVIHYLNDFLTIHANMTEARRYETEFNDLCARLDLSVNLKKNHTSTVCTFLSIELGTINMIARLPPDKH